MPKFSISSLLALTFWVAATITSVSLVQKSADSNSRMVIEVITAAFALATFSFACYSLFSAIFGTSTLRPFWIGCTVVCGVLIFIEPFIHLGFTPLCDLLALNLEMNRGGKDSSALQFGLNSVASSGVAAVWRSSLIPLVGCVGGILAYSISNESNRGAESAS